MPFITELIRKAPLTAASVLDLASGKPECTNAARHPVPRSTGYSTFKECSSSALGRFLGVALNPVPEVVSYYVRDNKWEFDNLKFQAPRWQELLTSLHKRRPPCVDIHVRVCQIPGLLCPEVFSAMASTAHPDLFKNKVVQALVARAWWDAAWRYDLLMFVLNVWAILLLTAGVWERERLGKDPSNPEFKVNSLDVGLLQGAAHFVGSKALVDLVFELLDMIGLCQLGRSWKVCTGQPRWSFFTAANKRFVFRNAAERGPDLASIFVRLAMLWFGPLQNLVALALMVSWAGFLGFHRSAENVAVVFLPILRSTYSLGPAILVTFIFFFALGEALLMVTHASSWHDYFLVFVLGEGDFRDGDEWQYEAPVLVYGGAVIFTIGFLNIFITVISEAYNVEKERIHITLAHERCRVALRFLVRASILPACACPWRAQREDNEPERPSGRVDAGSSSRVSRQMSSCEIPRRPSVSSTHFLQVPSSKKRVWPLSFRAQPLVIGTALAGMLGIQVYGFSRRVNPSFSVLATSALMFVLYLCVFQSANPGWAQGGTDRFLWFITRTEKIEEVQTVTYKSQEDRVREAVSAAVTTACADIREDVRGVKRLVESPLAPSGPSAAFTTQTTDAAGSDPACSSARSGPRRKTFGL